MKLQKMTDFVLVQRNPNANINEMISEYEKVINYDIFLKQPLTLEMFVPCDEDGNVLEEPSQEEYGWYSAESQEEESGWMYEEGEERYYEALKTFKIAQEKVLFKDFEFIELWGVFWHLKHISGKTILIRKDATTPIEKQLLAQPFEIELTESALKQIGINDTSHTSK